MGDFGHDIGSLATKAEEKKNEVNVANRAGYVRVVRYVRLSPRRQPLYHQQPLPHSITTPPSHKRTYTCYLDIISSHCPHFGRLSKQ
ncbi:hypothetical protein C0Q70_03039 [Pomacea canaliculata]|uniref:Uncharacterized protein n=1 Tax=Pomacea canaliculata TaxID=400727 RepID=A0A2T7PRL6_POMCA|nr:hypothetical protein C0Q70_03039 [Pomacea canaliculata]